MRIGSIIKFQGEVGTITAIETFEGIECIMAEMDTAEFGLETWGWMQVSLILENGGKIED